MSGSQEKPDMTKPVVSSTADRTRQAWPKRRRWIIAAVIVAALVAGGSISLVLASQKPVVEWQLFNANGTEIVADNTTVDHQAGAYLSGVFSPKPGEELYVVDVIDGDYGNTYATGLHVDHASGFYLKDAPVGGDTLTTVMPVFVVTDPNSGCGSFLQAQKPDIRFALPVGCYVGLTPTYNLKATPAPSP